MTHSNTHSHTHACIHSQAQSHPNMHTHQHVHTCNTSMCVLGYTSLAYSPPHLHTLTRIYPLQGPQPGTVPLSPPVPPLKDSRGYWVTATVGTRPVSSLSPHPFPTPTPTVKGSSNSPAWSGSHARRGWPPAPPCGRRTSQKHSLLQEKKRVMGSQDWLSGGHRRGDRETYMASVRHMQTERVDNRETASHLLRRTAGQSARSRVRIEENRTDRQPQS